MFGMDNMGIGGGLLSGSNGGLIDLETPMSRHQQNQMVHHLPFPHHQNMSMISARESDPRHLGLMEAKGSDMRGFSMSLGRGKMVCHGNGMSNDNMSEDDEPSVTEDGNGENSDEGKCRKGSMWHRMKWTDNVIRLLISAVAYVGDDSTCDAGEGHKRKSGILQKKGKWKTISKMMISKGWQVSPQQCEDKFNDLNKRYKKLNDILGRGISCRVVENPSLMDSMPHLSDKAKDDVRKILSSKHLFYTEMCAYHNGQRIPNCHDLDLQGCSGPLERCSKDNSISDEEEVERNNHTEDDDTDNEDNHNDEVDEERIDEHGQRKIQRKEDGHFLSQSAGMSRFQVELSKMFQDPSKSLSDRREWIQKQKLQLQEEKVSIQAQAFELEKQRLKWMRYRSKKDRELERLRLENEKMRLDTDQMILQLKLRQQQMDFRTVSHGKRTEGGNLSDIGRR